jgi:hypothetical protein
MKLEDHVRAWLVKHCQALRVQYWLRAAAAMALSLLILFCSFWFFYFPVDYAVTALWGRSVKTSLTVGVVVFIIYVIASLLVRPAHLRKTLHGSDPDEVLAANRVEARLITTIISYGPHLFVETFRLLGEAGRLRKVDMDGCAAALARLAKADARLAYSEIVPVIPGDHDPDEVMQQLRLLKGVLFLKSDPPGLSLTTALRKELRALQPAKKRRTPE